MRTVRRILVVVAAAVIAVLTVGVGGAHAAPASAAAPTAVSTASADGSSIITRLTNATFAATPVGGTLSILDRRGQVVEKVALSVPMNGHTIGLRTVVSADRSTATMTPQLSDTVRAAVADGLHPVASKKDRAYQKMIWHINNGWNRGGNVATAVGAVAGLIVGCIVIVGCIWGAGVGAAIGAVVGINGGDPQAGQAILDWINTP